MRLEGIIRDRVRALPSVRIADRRDAVGFVPAAVGDRITGVQTISRAPGSATETLTADLVVDAMERGTRTPGWLTELGYETPAEETVIVQLA
ncbi:hypothetical protein AB0I35_30340 [Nocardia sp. NPDC050378]|uniref:hypothetical protein n=1 Tax=Nocardia sp. NPDC050378 TaxID=3155400 RepID=UPI0034106376